jgi:PilZ domain
LELDLTTRRAPTVQRRGERRRAERWDCFVEARAEVAGHEFPCIVTDQSTAGAGAWCAGAEHAQIGTPITLRLPHRPPRRATIRHVTEDFVGVEYFEAT